MEDIRERFSQLNPYSSPEARGSLLELEDENFTDETRSARRQLWCYSISAKRYALYTQQENKDISLIGVARESPEDDYDDPEPALRKPSQHGLGHLLNPLDPEDDDRDWIGEIWQHILTGRNPPTWMDQPAVARTSISTPAMFRLFHALNSHKPYSEQIKPFNFLNAAFVHPTERPADDDRIVLVAPYEQDPKRWTRQRWINRFNARTYRITVEPSNGRVRPGTVSVKTYRDTILDYATHPEPKSLAPDEKVSDRTSIGLLHRRPVTPTIVQQIGKESNRLEEAQLGLLDDADQPLNRYGDAQLATFRELVVPVLKDLGVRETARRTGHGLGSVSAALAGRSTPRPGALRRYTEVAFEYADVLLSMADPRPATDPQYRLSQAVQLLSNS